MATPRSRNRQSQPPQQRVTYNRADPNHQTVDPRWLLRVLGWTVLAAFVCAWLAMCALFSLGSWQLVLHPAFVAGADAALPGEPVRFGPDSGGHPQLTGRFIPAADQTLARSSATVLYLRGGDGQLGGTDAPRIGLLHDLGLNVFAFDYRGYGRSGAKPHPSEETMRADAESAWRYLRGLRGFPANRIVIEGEGVGASLAAQLVAQHGDAAALILRNASADVLEQVRREPRSRFFPVRLLFHDRFPLATLQQSTVPKLLLDVSPGGLERRPRMDAYRAAADPKIIVDLPAPDPVKEREALQRFLEERAPPSAR